MPVIRNHQQKERQELRNRHIQERQPFIEQKVKTRGEHNQRNFNEYHVTEWNKRMIADDQRCSLNYICSLDAWKKFYCEITNAYYDRKELMMLI